MITENEKKLFFVLLEKRFTKHDIFAKNRDKRMSSDYYTKKQILIWIDKICLEYNIKIANEDKEDLISEWYELDFYTYKVFEGNFVDYALKRYEIKLTKDNNFVKDGYDIKYETVLDCLKSVVRDFNVVADPNEKIKINNVEGLLKFKIFMNEHNNKERNLKEMN